MLRFNLYESDGEYVGCVDVNACEGIPSGICWFMIDHLKEGGKVTLVLDSSEESMNEGALADLVVQL